MAGGPFYGFNRPGAKSSEAMIRQLVAAGDDGRREGPLRRIAAFSETDLTEDLKKISVPVLVLHGDDDQVCPTRIRLHCRRSC